MEKCKQKKMLEEMLEEMAGEFPALRRVFVHERDLYLAHSLHVAALQPSESTCYDKGPGFGFPTETDICLKILIGAQTARKNSH